MNDEILNNIFKKNSEKIYGTVIKSLGGESYKVVSNGKIIFVDSNIKWESGSGVSIKDGVIIGTASNITTKKIYQV